MKIIIIPTAYLPNDSGIACLWVSFKEHDTLLEHFKKLGFEITHEKPNWINTGMDNIWQTPSRDTLKEKK